MRALAGQARFLQLRVNGLAAPLLPTHFSGTEGLSELFEYRVEFISPADDLDEHIQPGSAARVTLNHPGAAAQYFHGHVQCLTGLEPVAGGGWRYEAILIPWLGVLDYNRDAESFVGLSVPEIVRQVFQAHGQWHYDLRGLKQNYPPLSVCVRYQESACAFVSRLLEEYGIYYYFRQEAERHVLVLEDAPFPLRAYTQALNYVNEQGGDTPHLASFSQRAQTTAPHFSARAFRPERPHEPAAGDGLQRPGTYRFPLAKAQTYRHQVTRDTTTHEHVSQRQQRLAQRARLESVDYEASGNYPGLSAGMQVCVRGETCAPTDRFYLYRLSHEAFDHSQHGYHAASERDTLEYGYQHTFQCYPQTHTYVPAETTPKPRIDGAIPAVVVGPPDTPVYSNGAGAVKVRFHWDRQADDLKGSSWVRVVQRFAGPEWGSQFLPRVGQEVLVMFTDGNPDKPVIVGSYYHAATPHPFEPVRQSGIKTQSLSGDNADAGHQLRLDDTPHQEELYLKSQRDQDVHVKGDSEQHIGQHSEIQVAGGPVLTQVGGDLRIEAAEALHLHVGTSEIVLDARGVHVHADTVTLDRVAPVPDAFAAPAQAPDSAPHPDDAAAVNAAPNQPADVDNPAPKTNPAEMMYPKVEVAVDRLINQRERVLQEAILIQKVRANGSVTMENLTSVNPLSVNKDALSLEAKNTLSDFFAGVSITSFSLDKAEAAIGGASLNGDYTVELKTVKSTPLYQELVSSITLNIFSKKFNNWHIEGTVTFDIIIQIIKKPEQPQSSITIQDIVKTYVHQLEMEAFIIGGLLRINHEALKNMNIIEIGFVPILSRSAALADSIQVLSLAARMV